MKRILLVNPPYDIQRYMGRLGKVSWVFPPLGLLHIASYIRMKEPSLDVRVYDFQVHHHNFFQELESFEPEIVGITCQTALVYSTLQLAAKIKQFAPQTKIVVGGIHATIRPQDLLKSDYIDIVVIGEGELTFLEVCLQSHSPQCLSKIKGIAYKERNAIVKTPERPMICDLSILPMPALDLVPCQEYRTSPEFKTGDRFGFIMTSRGCSMDCIFCANRLLTKGKHRLRSLGSIIEEIEYYLTHYQINQLFIWDDNFCLNKQRTLELCDEFIRRGYPKKFSWVTEASVHCLDKEVLQKMKDAGCNIISLGLESGNQRLLDIIHKHTTLTQTEETVRLIKKVGIQVRGCFILGLPTETRLESFKTILFAYSLPLDLIRFAIATPFPGTKLWDLAVAEGKIDPENIDWTRLSLAVGYTPFLPLYYPQGRSPKEIKNLQKLANFLFCLKPRILLSILRKTRDPLQRADMLQGIQEFIFSTFGSHGQKTTRN